MAINKQCKVPRKEDQRLDHANGNLFSTGVEDLTTSRRRSSASSFDPSFNCRREHMVMSPVEHIIFVQQGS
jgi:hypothetical protein